MFFILQEFVAELKGTSSTSKKVFNSTRVSYLNPSEKIMQNQKVRLLLLLLCFLHQNHDFMYLYE